MKGSGHRRANRSNRAMFVVGAGAIVLTAAALTQGRTFFFGDGHVGATILPGLKYMGTASCNGSNCHSADEAKMQTGQMIGDEVNIFEADKHSKAFATLKSKDSAEMAKALGIASAQADARCLSCHSVNAPEAQRGPKFALADGNSCESCHGPSEKWLDPHKDAGWTKGQRAGGTDALRTSWGLIDTSDLVVRADACISCHLNIDKDMIDAGHPELAFELGAYNTPMWYSDEDGPVRHWDDAPKSGTSAKLWAIGQMVSAGVTTKQSEAWKAKGWDTAKSDALKAVYDSGSKIAAGVFGATDAAGLAKVAMTPEQCAKAANELAATAGNAKTFAEMRVVAMGVYALAAGYHDLKSGSVPEALDDAFWEASDAADEEDSAALVAAVKKMAEMAK